MRYLLSCGLYCNWLGSVVVVHSDVRRRHAHARPALHGRVVQRSAVQSDSRDWQLQFASLSDQLCGVAVVWLDLLDDLRPGNADSFPNNHHGRNQRRLVSRALKLDGDERLQSWLLSRQLRPGNLVRLGAVLGFVRRRHADALALIDGGDVRRIVQRLANDAVATVQHELLPTGLPNLDVVGVERLLGHVQHRHSVAHSHNRRGDVRWLVFVEHSVRDASVQRRLLPTELRGEHLVPVERLLGSVRRHGNKHTFAQRHNRGVVRRNCMPDRLE